MKRASKKILPRIPKNSHLRNCHIEPAEGQRGPMFAGTVEHGVMAFLDGYAIIPKDKYFRLAGIVDTCPTNALCGCTCGCDQRLTPENLASVPLGATGALLICGPCNSARHIRLPT